jgi:hypothetical protein
MPKTSNYAYGAYSPELYSVVRETLHRLGDLDYHYAAEVGQVETSLSDEEIKKAHQRADPGGPSKAAPALHRPLDRPSAGTRTLRAIFFFDTQPDRSMARSALRAQAPRQPLLGEVNHAAAEVLAEAEDHRNLARVASDCLQPLFQRLPSRHHYGLAYLAAQGSLAGNVSSTSSSNSSTPSSGVHTQIGTVITHDKRRRRVYERRVYRHREWDDDRSRRWRRVENDD